MWALDPVSDKALKVYIEREWAYVTSFKITVV